jgi:hypothetical protein
MKKFLSNFADSLISGVQMKSIKGGYGTCGGSQQLFHCTTTGFSGGGSISGVFCAHSGPGANYDVNSHWQMMQAMGYSPSGSLSTSCS